METNHLKVVNIQNDWVTIKTKENIDFTFNTKFKRITKLNIERILQLQNKIYNSL